ncbi:DUF6586 family protein [Halomonas sp. Bachu 37]|uniref:DUF6586 family protein n=1 Tax=Halomonas kashgarensis TaxID=3084920 RepID=UPI003217A2C4
MTPQGRTNQLLYQAQLLLEQEPGTDEQAIPRQMAHEEGALALCELALESLLREVTEHARLASHDWRELLATDGHQVAELQRLRDIAAQPDSWLGWWIARFNALHTNDGAARRPSANPGVIAVGNSVSLGQALLSSLAQAKQEIVTLRETSQEW